MKTLYTLLLLFIPLLISAQDYPYDEEKGKVIYTDVVQAEGVSKDELYNRAKTWFAKTFNSANDVVQLDNKEDGHIIGRGITNMYIGSGTNKVHFTLDLQFKDGRYKYEVTNLAYQAPYSSSIPGSDRKYTAEELYHSKYKFTKKGEMRTSYKTYFEPADKAVKDLILSFKTALADEKPAESNW